MKTTSIQLLLALVFGSTLYGQQPGKQYANWCFGNMMTLAFPSPSLPPNTVPGSAMTANEGSSAISDTAGNLLFYSNGQTVWNRFNQIILNGTNLKGHYWSAQSALIVPLPGSDSLFYIFTVNNWTDATTELNYSIIDKNLNGGMGGITVQKNILVNANCREQLTAAMHANGTDIWILSHEYGNNHFVAYLLTAQGLAPTPVVSATGAVYSGMNRFGYMRVSPYCNRIATALGKQLEMNIPDTTAQVCDFDNATGIVSNALYLADLTNMESAYCCEFSPDNGKLYFTEFNGPGIFQFDLSVPNPASTLTDVSTSVSGTNASLTLGPDGRLYVTKAYSPTMGVILYPNQADTLCDHVDSAFYMPGGTNTIGTCNVLKGCTVNTSTGGAPSAMSLLNIFPNPAQDRTTVLLSGGAFPDSGPVYVEIMDLVGRIKSVLTADAALLREGYAVDLRSFSNGIYVVRLVVGHTTNHVLLAVQ